MNRTQHQLCYTVHAIHSFSLVTMKRTSNPDADPRPTGHISYISRRPSTNCATLPQMAPDQRSPKKMPDPWLFDTEHLLRELARCREMILLIPAKDAATHSAINIAISANWNLEQTLRYLLSPP